MDTGDRDKFEMEKAASSDNMNYDMSTMPPLDWRFTGANTANVPAGLLLTENLMAVCSSSCSNSLPVIDSFGQTLWHSPANVQNMGLGGFDVQNNASSSNAMGIRNAGPTSLRNSLFLPNAPGLLPQSLVQFPADSGFIERAARFSCFSGGNFSDTMNTPLGIPNPMGLYPTSDGMMQGQQDICVGSGSKLAPDGQSPKNELNVPDGSPLKNDRKSESLPRCNEEAKKSLPVSTSNVSDEVEFNGGNDGQNEPSNVEDKGEEHRKGLDAKKRKRIGQEYELDQHGAEQLGEASKDDAENVQKNEQNPSPTSNHTTVGKQGKQGSQASDSPKEGYIHVRARRGQATNSHSLAERVRREKISERMKFLQDLVPGCSKVTGKAVMLDEIINYVQSLQRQVEFLSMKLATVNPRLDFNIEGLLAKDTFHLRPGPSSTLPFAQDMPVAYPLPLHPPQPGLIQLPLSGIGNPSDVLRRTINSQLPPPMSGGFKHQEPNLWEGDLHNVVHMSYETGAPADKRDVIDSIPTGNMKAEP